MRACRRCNRIELDKNINQCQTTGCQSHDLSSDFSGVVIVLDFEKSAIAERMGITENGRYAIKVR